MDPYHHHHLNARAPQRYSPAYLGHPDYYSPRHHQHQPSYPPPPPPPPPRHHPHPFFTHQENLVRSCDAPVRPDFGEAAVEVFTARKRPRWDQDPRLLVPPDSPTRSHGRLIPREGVAVLEPYFEGPGGGDELLSRVSTHGFVLGGGEHGSRNGYLPDLRQKAWNSEYVPPLPPRGGEIFYGFERPPPLLRHYDNTRSRVEDFFDGNVTSVSEVLGLNENQGFPQDNRFLGKRRKRRMPTGRTSQSPVDTPSKKIVRKRSALSRIQSGMSVWERIAEKPAAVPSVPRSCPLGFSGGMLPEMDALDTSYKPNALAAKLLVPQCSTAPSNAENNGQVGKNLKKKVVKKKAVKKSLNAIFPGSLGSGSKEENVKNTVQLGSDKILSALEKKLDSVSRIVSEAKSQSCANDSAAAQVGKSAVKKSTKATNTNKTTASERGSNKEMRECAKAVISEIRTDDASSSQVCELEPVAGTSPFTEKNAAGKSADTGNCIEVGNVESISGEENGIPCDKNNKQYTDTVISDNGSLNEPFSQVQGLTIILSSSENGSLKELANAVAYDENGIGASSNEGELYQLQHVRSFVQIPSFLALEGGRQSHMPNASVSPLVGTDPLEGENLETKSDREGLELKSEVGQLKKQLDLLSEYENKNCNLLMDPHEECTLTHLCPVVDDIGIEQIPLNVVVDDCSLETSNEPTESDCLRLGKDGAVLLGDSLDERMGDDVQFRLAERDSDAPDMVNIMDAGQYRSGDGKNIENRGNKNSSEDERSVTLEAEDDVKWEKLMQLLTSNESKRPGPADPRLAHGGKIMISKSFSGPRSQGLLPNRRSSAGSFKVTASNRKNRSKTWHRSKNIVSASPLDGNQLSSGVNSVHKPSPKKLGKLHSSYVRKGNSLIRKSAGEASIQCPSYDLGSIERSEKEMKIPWMSKSVANNSVTDHKVDTVDHVSCPNPYSERPKTPSLPLSNKSHDLNANPSLDGPHTMSEDLISESGLQAQTGPPELLDSKRMIYVKPKSYQLVAASGPGCAKLSLYSTEKAQNSLSFACSDLYHRKKKNQLVRNASTDFQQKQDVVMSVDNSNSDDQRASNSSSLESSKAGLHKKAQQKTYKHSKFSLVWTLSGEQSHIKGASLLNQRKYLPYLFPWKRTCWKRSRSATALMSNRPSSLLTRKLQLARKRNTVYTISNDGYSLRKAGVLSVGGSSLKWSKSIESRSKKASEEATLAVAEAERKKRERKRRTSFGRKEKNGERIFRIGSARYKMDSSKRTLIRIPDDQFSGSNGPQSGNDSQKSLVPKRLLIGNDEYIRIGNGNQLIRDPKKLVRILANEKVRWSLHTARLRLARKQQYCQFFTRFGKCNKNGGRCPYIHDPAKVAICTKFLKGLCSTTNCKLTHKVLPERMPDCSYFLQGLCTNVNCPYRHVNVNPTASVCEGFLRGYCDDGDECRKKHSYVCPLFEATGKCPLGSTCKLHHPKTRNKSKKRKRTAIPSNSKRRYFCSSITEVGEPMIVALDNIGSEKGGDLFCSDGQFTDYVSLDVSGDDGTETSLQMDFHPGRCNSVRSDMQPDDLDSLIKPVLIMNKANLMQSSANG